MDLYNGFNGLRHRINWTYFSVLDGLAHPLYSLWGYDPKLFSDDNVADGLSVALSLREIVDERIEEAIDECIERELNEK